MPAESHPGHAGGPCRRGPGFGQACGSKTSFSP